MSRLAVFAGPSLHGYAAPHWLRAVLRPPIRHGDLARLPGIGDGGWVVAIVDGEFGQSLAVTVTEIRDVLEAGNTVLGGGSMGALRAVECRPLGMRAVGWIAEQYASGAVWADDEVALTHLPAESGYRPLTVPLVTVRWLLSHRLGLPAERVSEVVRACAGVHFRDRTAGRLCAAVRHVDPGVAARLEEWLCPSLPLRWDRKHQDALAVIDAARREVS